MLHEREYQQDRIEFKILPISKTEYRVTARDYVSNNILKSYITEDDEAAVGMMEALIMCNDREGIHALEKFDVNDRLSKIYTHFIRVEKQ